MIQRGAQGADGIAIGEAYVYERQDVAIDRGGVGAGGRAQELAKLQQGINTTREQLRLVKEEALARVSENEARIFDAHLLFLDDPAFTGEMAELIENRQITAPYAVELVVEKYTDLFAAMDDEYMRERAADIRDVGARLTQNVVGLATGGLEQLTKAVIVVAHDLTPADIIALDKKLVKGLAIDKGGRTSHTAIIARTLEIPAVLGLGDISGRIRSGDDIILDGAAGLVITGPTAAELAEYRQKAQDDQARRAERLKAASLPAVTRDGRRAKIRANIGSPQDIEAVILSGGEGVGLYRTEYLFMERDGLPGEEEQFAAYRAVAAALAGKPVIIRTLDIGGDKAAKCLAVPPETNPFLGWRAIRISLSRPDIFKTQLRAILRASHYGKVALMYPMISGIGEVRAANAVLAEAKQELLQAGLPFDSAMAVGIMVETPAAALTVDTLVKEVDFFSIGTNDLCQYTLAVDRLNEKISSLYQPLHPAVLRLISNIIDVAHQHGKPCGMCGELAGDPAATMLLLGLGLDELSMSAAAIPLVKDLIRRLSYSESRAAAQLAMAMETPDEIRQYCAKLMERIPQPL